jgi:short-subunit dehydrogenase
MKKAIVIGASSGIGRELALLLGQHGYTVGLAARRVDWLNEVAGKLPGSVVQALDVSRVDEAMAGLSRLIEELGGVDLVVISAGTGHLNPDLEWAPERETIDVNVSGFAAMATVAMRHFLAQGRGHLVGISSIAALRGGAAAPAYNASKAFASNYLQGLRQKAAQLGLPIIVTDIQPGLVDTAMAKGEGLFWVQPPSKAAAQIMTAIQRQKNHAYITRRWTLFAWLLQLLPDAIYNRRIKTAKREGR